ncbi:MAG: hypothetical protein ABIQ95_00530, partial [Bdellovibrionia bacterium]
MSNKRKKDEVDFLEGFDFEAALAGEISGPEALVPNFSSQPQERGEHVSKIISKKSKRATDSKPAQTQKVEPKSIQDEDKTRVMPTEKTRVNPAEDPCKSRVMPTEKTRVNPAEDPCKSRVNENADLEET